MLIDFKIQSSLWSLIYLFFNLQSLCGANFEKMENESQYQLFDLKEVPTGKKKKKKVYQLQKALNALDEKVIKEIKPQDFPNTLKDMTYYTFQSPSQIIIKRYFFLLERDGKLQILCPYINAKKYCWKVEINDQKIEVLDKEEENEAITCACWAAEALLEKEKVKKVEILLDIPEKEIKNKNYRTVLQFTNSEKIKGEFLIAKKYVAQKEDGSLVSSKGEEKHKVSLYSLPLKPESKIKVNKINEKKAVPTLLTEKINMQKKEFEKKKKKEEAIWPKKKETSFLNKKKILAFLGTIPMYLIFFKINKANSPKKKKVKPKKKKKNSTQDNLHNNR